MFKGISNKLTMYMGIFIVLVLIVVSGYSYFQSKRNAYDLLTQIQTKTVDDIVIFFSYYDYVKRNAVKAAANEIARNPNMTLQEIYSVVKSVGEASNFAVFYAGFEDGSMIRSNGNHQTPADGYDPRGRTWYKEVKNNPNEVFVSDPYIAPSLKAPSMSYSYPIVSNGKFIGAVGGNYDLSEYSANVLSMGKSRDGYSVVLAKDGTVMFSEEVGKMLQKTKLAENIMEAYLQTPEGKDGKISKETLIIDDGEGGNRAVICESPKMSKYYVCSIMAESVYTNTIEDIFFKQLLVGVLSIVVALILIKFLISLNLKHLSTIQQGLLSFFKYINYETKQAPKPIAITSNDEFGSMAKAINDN
ncbi:MULTISPECIES: PDC sensor domain-containing protein, partial [Helicobacter]